MLGYATALHGFFFILGLVGYNRINALFPSLILPFLTPFGTPISAGILHTILYWLMLIGMCNYITFFVAGDIESGMWKLLRLTPYTNKEILLAKVAAAWHVWWKVLVMLVVTRVIAALLIPIAIFMQRQNDVRFLIAPNALGAIVFIAQPIVDAMMVSSISVLCALLFRSNTWANVGAYGLSAVAVGGLGSIAGFWLLYASPLGALAGPLIPLSHWASLIAAISPPRSPDEFAARMIVAALTYLVAPLLITAGIYRLSVRIARVVE